MVTLTVLFGLLSGSLLAVLVGILGSKRNIGFGWTFFLSIVFTPLVGLICALVSEPLPQGEPRKWGCLASLIAAITLVGIVLLAIMLLGVAA
ncbi:MAG: hypothetical protein J6R13_00360 [Alistipes sp.]|nr:hypothetical protein [Alistipes sp.]